MKNTRALRNSRLLLLVISILTFFLMGLGSYVRATGAGLSCPDWPLCFGRLVPPDFGNGVFQEVFHRYVAGFVLVLTAAFAFLTYKARPQLVWPWRFARILFALLIVQAIVGGLTVLMLVNPFIVTTHLALATIFFQVSLAAVSYLKVAEAKMQPTAVVEEDNLWSRKAQVEGAPRLISKTAYALAGFVYAQIALGGFVGASGAALACPEIPWCSSLLAGPQQVQMVHRILGAGIALLSLFLVVASMTPNCPAKIKRLIMVTFGLILVQVCIGFANVYYKIPIVVTLLHLVVAQGILAMLVAVIRRLNELPTTELGTLEEGRLVFPRELMRPTMR